MLPSPAESGEDRPAGLGRPSVDGGLMAAPVADAFAVSPQISVTVHTEVLPAESYNPHTERDSAYAPVAVSPGHCRLTVAAPVPPGASSVKPWPGSGCRVT